MRVECMSAKRRRDDCRTRDLQTRPSMSFVDNTIDVPWQSFFKVHSLVVVVTFFNHSFVNCKAALIWRLKIYEIKYNISLNDVHT